MEREPPARRSQTRREGSLAAALLQSMALAVTGTAGAYPSWVLVKGGKRDVVLGASWAVTRINPAPGSPLLGSAGGPVMFAIAYCCLLSAATGSLALTLDFLGRRQGRGWAPLLHGATAVLIASAAACGSCLLALVRGRVRSEPALAPLGLSTSPGQSLFLSFLACALAAAATGLSCSSPAHAQPARSSWDLGRAALSRRSWRTEPKEPPSRTPSLESVMWQEGRLSSFLLHAPLDDDDDDDLLAPRCFDYAQQPRAPASHHGLLQDLAPPHDDSPGAWGSVDSRVTLQAPAPSVLDCQLPPQGATTSSLRDGPWLHEEVRGEPPAPTRRQSLTWTEAAARGTPSGSEPRNPAEGTWAGRQVMLWPEEDDAQD